MHLGTFWVPAIASVECMSFFATPQPQQQTTWKGKQMTTPIAVGVWSQDQDLLQGMTEAYGNAPNSNAPNNNAPNEDVPNNDAPNNGMPNEDPRNHTPAAVGVWYYIRYSHTKRAVKAALFVLVLPLKY
ncbi:hypothetical protein BS47DRAFT_1365299 [Hydnum rufescens UP504]|uniref:Uncharacterized protein n=1 Tax=Hydnum rufescens UP504 TaxID=1448309 RepID=A0A9P6DT97_9AGAM|nr:hypothetical protein BS47DRAFT_1365299 [Hydnum rufescens UP504]